MQIKRGFGPGRGFTLLGHPGLTTRKTGADTDGRPHLFDHFDRDRQPDALGLIQMLGPDAELGGCRIRWMLQARAGLAELATR